MQSPVVREHAGIADDQVIMKSIALGCRTTIFGGVREEAGRSHPINRRAAADRIAR
jgi:hypothetical protein